MRAGGVHMFLELCRLILNFDCLVFIDVARLNRRVLITSVSIVHQLDFVVFYQN